MESQGTSHELLDVNGCVVTNVIPPLAPPTVAAQCPPIPPTPFFHSYLGAGNQIPFLYPHTYMPPIQGFGFRAPAQSTPIPTIDLTEGSQKRVSPELVGDQSQPNKKRRAPKKKPKIVELDDAKDEVELLKNAHHWKDHWVIQLITLPGEMQNTFNSPPKQVMSPNFFSSNFHVFFVCHCVKNARI